jgi:sialidase-1
VYRLVAKHISKTMEAIQVIDRGILYENCLPQLRSRQAYFPSVIKLPGNILLASYVVGEAFESIDQTTVVAISYDSGTHWQEIGPIQLRSNHHKRFSDYLKLSWVENSTILAFGYEFDRANPERPLGNPETGGVLDSRITWLRSEDLGRTWSEAKIIGNSYQEPVEASCPLIIVNRKHWVAPIANFADWSGQCLTGLHGRLLQTFDGGSTWDDSMITMEFPGRRTTVWEQRLCQLDTGGLLVIAWNEDLDRNMRLPNHVSMLEKGADKFSGAQSTGIMGQSSYLLNLGRQKILALHCIRRDATQPGIWAMVVDISKPGWHILSQTCIWEPPCLLTADHHLADIFQYTKFGQPSVIKLDSNIYYMVNWCMENGQGKIIWTKFTLDSSIM